MDALKSYHWPGNIRELENILERAYILETTDTLTTDHFPAELLSTYIEKRQVTSSAKLSLADARSIAVTEFERSYLEKLLTHCKGKINLSARKAGITARQLNRLMSRYDLHKEYFKQK